MGRVDAFITLKNKAEENDKAALYAARNNCFNAAVSRNYYAVYQHILFALEIKFPNFDANAETQKINEEFKKQGSDSRAGTHEITINKYFSEFQGHLSYKNRKAFQKLSAIKKCRRKADYNYDYAYTQGSYESFKATYDIILSGVKEITQKIENGGI